MSLLTQEIKRQLEANWTQNAGGEKEIDFEPVVKIFNPTGTGTWLFTELNPNDGDTLFGLCDLGYPEIGYASLEELESYSGIWGLGLERDLSFKAEKTLSQYANEAHSAGRIVA